VYLSPCPPPPPQPQRHWLRTSKK